MILEPFLTVSWVPSRRKTVETVLHSYPPSLITGLKPRCVNEIAPREVLVRLEVAGNRIKVTQNHDASDCGFGNRVFADGTYAKVKAGKPKFDDPK